MLPQTKPRTRRRETKDMVAMVRTRTKIRIKEVANGHMETTLTWWPTQTPGSGARITILKGTKEAGQLHFFKQKTAYEIMSGDWSSDVCSSDLPKSKSAPRR